MAESFEQRLRRLQLGPYAVRRPSLFDQALALLNKISSAIRGGGDIQAAQTNFRNFVQKNDVPPVFKQAASKNFLPPPPPTKNLERDSDRNVIAILRGAFEQIGRPAPETFSITSFEEGSPDDLAKL